MFDLHGNADKTDYYEDLSCAITILGKVLTGIDEYISDEMRNSRLEASSPKKGETLESIPKKSSDTLEQIKKTLELIHGKIGALVISQCDGINEIIMKIQLIPAPLILIVPVQKQLSKDCPSVFITSVSPACVPMPLALVRKT